MASDTGCCGVSLAQCHLLLEVEEKKRTNVTELAEILDLDKSTLSRTVDGMWRAGLLSRETDPDNRRQQIIRLTDKGREKAGDINQLCDDSYARLFERISDREKAVVVQGVSILAKALRGMREKRAGRRGAGSVER